MKPAQTSAEVRYPCLNPQSATQDTDTPSVDQMSLASMELDGQPSADDESNCESLLQSPEFSPIFSTKTGFNSMWISLENLDEKQAKQVQVIFSNGSWDYLRGEALKCHRWQSRARGELDIPSLKCHISHDRFACGKNNLVLAVSFSDSTHWVVKIRFPDDDPDIVNGIQSEVSTVWLIQNKTSIPVPTVIGYDATRYNHFGYTYVFQTYLPGHHLESSFATSVPHAYQEKVAKQFAEILYQLSTKMIFEKVGRVWQGERREEKPSIISFNTTGAVEDNYGRVTIGPFSTSLEYFYHLRQNENDAVVAALFQGDLGKVDEVQWLAACQLLGQSLSSLVLGAKINGPFPLKHFGLHHENILFDDDYNVTGVVGWSNAQTVPFESFAVCRELIVPPGLSEDVVAQHLFFRDLVQQKWKRREGNESDEEEWLFSDIVGTTIAQLVNFSFTSGALRRTVAYARMVGGILFGDGFSLENAEQTLAAI